MFHNPFQGGGHTRVITTAVERLHESQRCADLSCVASSASCSGGVRQFREGFELEVLLLTEEILHQLRW